jgi:hypothetical protein
MRTLKSSTVAVMCGMVLWVAWALGSSPRGEGQPLVPHTNVAAIVVYWVLAAAVVVVPALVIGYVVWLLRSMATDLSAIRGDLRRGRVEEKVGS